MSEGELSSTYSVCSDAAGVAGNLFAFVLFVSPLPTFRRIIRNRSTEEFSGLPYIYTLLNCLICLWYGMPIVCSGIILIATVNSVGAVFQLTYIAIFIRYTHNENKVLLKFRTGNILHPLMYFDRPFDRGLYFSQVKMLGLLLAVFSVFGIIALLSLRAFEPPNRQLFVGYLSVFSLISMFASPLFIINLVIRTRSVEYMPFYLSLAAFLMSISFFVYGLLKQDPFIYVPNGAGEVLGAIQLVLYFYYSRTSVEACTRPLLENHDVV